MEPFKVHILGCGSALPTSKHNASSQVVEIREKLFMIDCGEGTQVQLRRSRIRFTKISCVFISHLHGDHCFGLMGLISTFGLLGRTSTLRVYAPQELEEILKAQMQLFCNGLDFKVEFHAVDTTVSKVIYEDRSLTVTTLPLDHRIACCGFLFREKQGLPHIRRDMLDCYDIPLSQVNNIKNGADWTTVDGEVIPHTLLTTPADSPRSYAYCSDTRYMPQLYRLLEGVGTLYHESTYGNENVERARLYYHSTAAQAAQVARDAKVKKLILGHYSARYDDEKTLLKEAMQIFPNCLLGNEGMTINVE
jgi:ribonuclease Z